MIKLNALMLSILSAGIALSGNAGAFNFSNANRCEFSYTATKELNRAIAPAKSNEDLPYGYARIQKGSKSYIANVAMCGHGFNKATANGDSYDKKDAKGYNSILNDDFLTKMYSDGYSSDATTNATIIHEFGMDYETILNKISVSNNHKSKAGASYGAYSAEATVGFKLDTNLEISSSTTQYYYYGKYINEVGTWGFRGSNHWDDFRNNLDSQYLKDLDNAFNGTKKWSDFFTQYGTCLVTSIVVGGSYDLYYLCTSKTLDISEDFASTIESSITGSGMYNGVKFQGEDSNVFHMSTAMNTSSKSCTEKINVKFRGGLGAYAPSTLEEVRTVVPEWAKTIYDDLGVLTIYDSIDLWDILPEKYNKDLKYSEKMENAFNQYRDSIIEDSLGHSILSDKLESPVMKAGGDKDYVVGKGESTMPWWLHLIGVLTFTEPIMATIQLGYEIAGLVEVFQGAHQITDNTNYTNYYRDAFYFDFTKNTVEDNPTFNCYNPTVLYQKQFNYVDLNLKFRVRTESGSKGLVRIYNRKATGNNPLSEGYLVAQKYFTITTNSEYEQSIVFEDIDLSQFNNDELVVEIAYGDGDTRFKMRDLKVAMKYARKKMHVVKTGC